MSDYAELRAAIDAGPTPGPWSGRTGGLDAGMATDCAIHTWERCIAQITDNPLNQRDMAYIAAAHPEAIRALLAERDALLDQHHRDSKELRRLCAQRDAARKVSKEAGVVIAALKAERDALRNALMVAIEQIEYDAVKIDGEWGDCRDIDELERDGELPEALIIARAALAQEES